MAARMVPLVGSRRSGADPHVHLPQLRPGLAQGRDARRRSRRPLRDLRPGRFAGRGQGDPARGPIAEESPAAFRPDGRAGPGLELEERHGGDGRRGGDRSASTTRSPREVYPEYEARLGRCGPWTSTTWSAVRCVLLRENAKVPQEVADPHRPPARRRVPGHQRGPARAGQAAGQRRRATSASWATTISRSTAGAAPTWATSWSSRSTFPAPS